MAYNEKLDAMIRYEDNKKQEILKRLNVIKNRREQMKEEKAEMKEKMRNIKAKNMELEAKIKAKLEALGMVLKDEGIID